METGKISWYDQRKGYGFINLCDGSQVFIHRSNLKGNFSKELVPGREVTFKLVNGERGPKAEQVSLD
ncbi:Cold shock-like protein CspD [Limihaloglobus sulfuriphilus]|uniref:Cold shock-like protein CspD n=1 Tax=Limihaloglobus sulfuriphilus TaxID=1851148 RepID=A0A1Q2MF10_9BACT|nr:cold shock domain-containing protein [Limihaloglobus sulfuriphilus]AQQ70832.1 Cold shock-like protein CspD [Limihaloglobus sulfuriphilus]